MSDRRADDLRALLEQIDARLREAERLRDHVEHRDESPFWPDRRRVARVPAMSSTRRDERERWCRSGVSGSTGWKKQIPDLTFCDTHNRYIGRSAARTGVGRSSAVHTAGGAEIHAASSTCAASVQEINPGVTRHHDVLICGIARGRYHRRGCVRSPARRDSPRAQQRRSPLPAPVFRAL